MKKKDFNDFYNHLKGNKELYNLIENNNVDIDTVLIKLNEKNNEYTTINENLFTLVKNYIRGRKLVKAYWVSLGKSIDIYIKETKKIDKEKQSGLEGKELENKRSITEKDFKDKQKQLSDVRKEINDIKKDSSLIRHLDKVEELKYKIKSSVKGRKAGVNLSKVSGINDKIDSINKIKNELKDSKEKLDTETSKLKDEVQKNKNKKINKL